MKQIDTIRAALELARDYIASDLASERGAFSGYEGLSRIDEIKADIEGNAAALAALAELERAAAEPVATVVSERGGVPDGTMLRWSAPPVVGTKLYTTPPPAKPAMGMFTAEEVEVSYIEGHDAAKYDTYTDRCASVAAEQFPYSDTFKLIQERTK